MKHLINISILVTIFSLVLVDLGFAQNESDTTYAVTARGVDDDKNEIKEEMSNLPDADVTAPEYKKEGKDSRGALNYTSFDNYTPWYVRCYIDGVYQGTMSPWGSYSVRLPTSGRYRLYAKAVFDDGSYSSWGGINRYISGGFTWNLYP